MGEAEDEATGKALGEKLRRNFVDVIKLGLVVTKNADDVRTLFERCLATAQDEYMEEHKDEIVDLVIKAFANKAVKDQKALDEKSKGLERFRDAAAEAGIVHCRHCGTPVLADAKFCIGCGRKVE